MKDYKEYNATEFAQDDDFQNWVKYPNEYPELDKFWKQWVYAHPEKSQEIEEGKNLITAVLIEGNYTWPEERKKALLSKIDASIASRELRVNVPRQSKNFYLKIAAAVTIVIGSLSVWLLSRSDKRDQLSVNTTSEFVKEINNGENPKTIVLEDGSSIVLQPKSILQYPETFDKNFREVRLTGEAFFEVAKDPSKPFLVYADEIVTKVLGTSFTVKAFEDDETLLVQVKTGMVSVFTREEIAENKSNGNRLEGLILSPNQQAIFSRNDSRIAKSLVDNPAVLNNSAKQKFEFTNTSIPEVFETIEKAYGVQIVYDRDVFSSCVVNASLDDIPLYDKMRVICKGVDAHYEIVDSRIVVTGKGCSDWANQ